MQVDVKQIRFASALAHNVVVPNFLGQCLAHRPSVHLYFSPIEMALSDYGQEE
jgi:hypothetical protein